VGCVLIAHTGWNKAHERGSSVLRGATRISASASRTSEGIILFKNEKMNSGKKPMDRYFEIKQIGSNDMQTILVPASQDQSATQDALTERQLQVLQAIAMPSFANGVTRTELIKYLETYNIPTQTVYKCVNSLIKKELVINKGNNMVVITADGKYISELSSTSDNSGQKASNYPYSHTNWIITDYPPLSPDSPSLSSDYPSQIQPNSPNSPPVSVYKTEQGEWKENEGEKEDNKGEKTKKIVM
jgi:predicted transcriptional regulator